MIVSATKTESPVDEKDQNALDETVNSLPSHPANESDIAEREIATSPKGTDDPATDNGQIGTLSEPDKVTDAVAPEWTNFADLTLDQKFAQAKLMGFDVRDAYLHERCRAAKLEVAYAASALDRISSRADQMDEAVSMIQNAKSVCEDLKDQIESWKDNLPENFQDKASQLEECVDALEQVVNSLDEAESNAENVEFPGTY